ncbi:MAG: 16S rRNA (guanine(527)-N(7))-methyltransferase RsmG [Myxococcota bacterium]|jgi:16S rRNA (guanine(527)-N(7))-methyltransferase RsmG|nr:16S rRNA (guanine(527)-N(7))-methyltransferase RsmG [Myxococcota bacterium]
MAAGIDLRSVVSAQLPEERVEAVVAGVGRYLELLERWNRTHNLTGFRRPEDLIRLGIGDSLVPLPLLPPDEPAVDVGSGAGFPAIPLALAEPGRRWLLMEPRRKRASFLGEVCHQLALTNVTVRRERLEVSGPALSLVTSRAVGGLTSIVPGRLAPGGVWIVATTLDALDTRASSALALDTHTPPTSADSRCWARYRRA